MDVYIERIKPLFEKSGKTDAELEIEIGLPRGIIYKWNNGVVKSYKKYCGQIANYLGVSSDYLLGIEKPTSKNGDGLDEVLERLRTRPECRMLFKLADGATPDDVEKAAAIIEALRKVEGK